MLFHPKPGPSLSSIQPLGSPKDTPGMSTFKLLHLDMDASTASSVFQYGHWPGNPRAFLAAARKAHLNVWPLWLASQVQPRLGWLRWSTWIDEESGVETGVPGDEQCIIAALVGPQAGEEIRTWNERRPKALGPASSFQSEVSLSQPQPPHPHTGTLTSFFPHYHCLSGWSIYRDFLGISRLPCETGLVAVSTIPRRKLRLRMGKACPSGHSWALN